MTPSFKGRQMGLGLCAAVTLISSYSSREAALPCAPAVVSVILRCTAGRKTAIMAHEHDLCVHCHAYNSHVVVLLALLTYTACMADSWQNSNQGSREVKMNLLGCLLDLIYWPTLCDNWALVCLALVCQTSLLQRSVTANCSWLGICRLLGWNPKGFPFLVAGWVTPRRIRGKRKYF